MNNQPPKVNPRFPLLRMLITTMEKVVEAELPLEMISYFGSEMVANEAKDIHTCGTPACVAGYGAVTPEIQKFLDIDTEDFRSQIAAEQVFWALHHEIGKVADAIVAGSQYLRRDAAEKYLPQESQRFTHLRTETPTASEALEFMKHVLALLLDGLLGVEERKQPHPHRYTSEEILADKDIAFYNIPERVSSGMPIRYILADEEWGWMEFVEGKYSIHDYIMENLEWVDPDDPEAENQVPVLTITCADELSRALDADCGGAGKAVCLADDTALQAIFFSLYQEDWNERLEDFEDAKEEE
ncbi:hypothetical protein KUL118_01460 [Tenacibaculum sp. KUL118]|nr:hypothetical protein KUL118_01460 [Tenacibaculum sp. KUL118]